MKRKKLHKIVKTYAALLSAYVVGLLWLVPALIKDTYHIQYGLFKSIFALVIGVILYFCLLKIVEKFNGGITLEKSKYAKQKRGSTWFIIGFAITFIIMMIYYYAFFPGSFTNDNIQQWEQVQSGNFLDWHPVLHTYLLYIISLLVNHYGFVVFIQIILFCSACGYLLTTLAKWGFPKWCIIASEVFIIANPMTRHLYIGLLKDAAFSICILVLVTFLINIFLSNGNWLKPRRNSCVFTLVMVLISIFRHNGILITVPLLVLLLSILVNQRKRLAFVAIVTITLIGIIKYPIYNLLDVERPNNQFVETMGLPMTVLCNIKVLEPNRLTKEADVAMDAVGYKDEIWENYELGNFNSIKWHSGACGYLDSVDRNQFIKMTGEMIVKEPGLSLQAVYQLTRMGWDVRGDVNWDIVTDCYENKWNYTWSVNNKNLRDALLKMDNAMWTNVTKTFFSYTGIYILLLMLVGFISLKRYGLSVLYLILPILCYDFGTMVLLCGTDYRFFHFNSMIMLPLCLAMLVKQGKKQTG